MQNDYFLILNAGSSSLKFAAIPVDEGGKIYRGLLEINTDGSKVLSSDGKKTNHDVEVDAIDILEGCLQEANLNITAIGHRVVHGGNIFFDITELNDEVIKQISDLSTLAPLHNPPAVGYMRKLLSRGKKQYAYFDTATTQNKK